MKEKIILPNVYPMYELAYGSDFPTEQYFVHVFNSLPSKLSNQKFYDPTIVDYIIENGYIIETCAESSRKQHNTYYHKFYVNHEAQIVFHIVLDNDKKNELLNVEIIYNIRNGELDTQIDMEKISTFERPKKKSSISLVKTEMGHLDTEEYDLNVPEMDLELNYGHNFKKIYDIVIEKLNEKNGKGILLLHGSPGTGKSFLIKYITKYIVDKEILFIPPSMSEALSEPSILPFLMEHKNSILIIEDAEKVIADREINGSSPGVSNILNLTDGILADCLGIQIIATFNMKREKIDQALLRKGRLIAEHKFDALSVEDTNKLLKHLNKNKTVNQKMTLADIYNIDEDAIRSESDKQQIGFK